MLDNRLTKIALAARGASFSEMVFVPNCRRKKQK
jgi:hypothetical protein